MPICPPANQSCLTIPTPLACLPSIVQHDFLPSLPALSHPFSPDWQMTNLLMAHQLMHTLPALPALNVLSACSESLAWSAAYLSLHPTIQPQLACPIASPYLTSPLPNFAISLHAWKFCHFTTCLKHNAPSPPNKSHVPSYLIKIIHLLLNCSNNTLKQQNFISFFLSCTSY
jgi:hypothetical protein